MPYFSHETSLLTPKHSRHFRCAGLRRGASHPPAALRRTLAATKVSPPSLSQAQSLPRGSSWVVGRAAPACLLVSGYTALAAATYPPPLQQLIRRKGKRDPLCERNAKTTPTRSTSCAPTSAEYSSFFLQQVVSRRRRGQGRLCSPVALRLSSNYTTTSRSYSRTAPHTLHTVFNACAKCESHRARGVSKRKSTNSWRGRNARCNFESRGVLGGYLFVYLSRACYLIAHANPRALCLKKLVFGFVIFGHPTSLQQVSHRL